MKENALVHCRRNGEFVINRIILQCLSATIDKLTAGLGRIDTLQGDRHRPHLVRGRSPAR
jgi:hypothetical protein